jgi:hypothetical protein
LLHTPYRIARGATMGEVLIAQHRRARELSRARIMRPILSDAKCAVA